MRRYILAHLPVGVLYGVLVVGLNVLFSGFGGASFWVREGLFVLGVLVGVLLLFLDRVVYVYSYPEEQLSQQFMYLWKRGKVMRALGLLDTRRREQQRLTFRSALFLVVWVLLAFFALTSTASGFGKGVVMGVGFHVLYDAWRLQRMAPEKLNTRFFWQIKREFSREVQLLFLWVMTGVFVLFSLWA